jgi:hypothetical protein
METKNYFQHDYRSRLDGKLLEVRMKHGMTGFGLYWCLVEMLHEGNGFIKMKPEVIAFELQVPIEIIKDVIDICFKIEDGIITCNRVKENLTIREEKRLAKSKAGKKGMDKRWSSYNTTITNNNTTITKHNIEKEKEKEIVIDKVKDKLLQVYTARDVEVIEDTNVDYMIDETDIELTRPMLERMIDKFISVDSRFKLQSIMSEINEDYGGFDNLIEMYLPNDTSAQNNFRNKLKQYNNGIYA